MSDEKEDARNVIAISELVLLGGADDGELRARRREGEEAARDRGRLMTGRKPSWEEIKATRTKTEHLVERLLREHYPELEFQTGAEILGFLPDFYFPAKRMLLEIDGSIHDDYRGQTRDHRKDEKLRAAGYSVFRLRNVDIWNRPVAAAHVIASTLGIFREGVDQQQTWDAFYRRRAARR